MKAALKNAKVRVNTVNGSTVHSLAFIRVKIHGVETPTLAIVVPAQNLKNGEVLVDNDTLAYTGINLQKLLAQRKAATGDNPLVSFDVTDPIGPDDEGYNEVTAPSSDEARSSTIGQPLPGEWLGYVEDHEQISPEAGEVPTALVESKSLAEAMQADVYLSEMQCKRLLTDNPGLFKHKTYKISDVEISDKLTPEQAAELRQTNLQLKDVFATSDKLPKQMTHATPADTLGAHGSNTHVRRQPQRRQHISRVHHQTSELSACRSSRKRQQLHGRLSNLGAYMGRIHAKSHGFYQSVRGTWHYLKSQKGKDGAVTSQATRQNCQWKRHYSARRQSRCAKTL